MVLFVERVGVVGAGAMGAAIAEVMALNGKQVVLKDVDQKAVDAGMKRIRTVLDELVAFHKSKAGAEIERIEALGVTLTDDQKTKVREAKKATYDEERAQRILKSITPTTSYEPFREVDFVIEAAFERLDVKQKVFRELEAATERHVILATNTSSLPITDIASVTQRRPKCVGLHFFNPPYTLPLVEVVPGLETHDGTVEDVMGFIQELRNHRFPMLPVRVKETPGFLVNRILGRMLTEAFLCLEEGIAGPRDIDLAMRAGAGMPMGPLELADMVGVDVIHHVAENMKMMGASAYQREPQIVKKLYAAGRFGKKAGRGFYDYDEGSR